MNPEDPIERYLAELQHRLHLERGRVRCILAEVEEHLRETAESLQRQGLPAREARLRAVACFGTSEALAQRFHHELDPTEEEKMTRLFLTATALFTSAVALLIGVHTVLVREGAFAWLLQKFLGAIVVAGVGTLTLYHFWLRGTTGILRRLLWLGAAALISLGLTTVLITVRLAVQSGDWESYAVGAGFVLIGQGLGTLAALWKQAAHDSPRLVGPSS